MPKANAIRTIIFVVIITGFLLGVVKLFLLRFEAGDIYPPYSTLRSDPIGSRAFYRSLENLRNISVQRNYQTLANLEFEQPSTFFFIGASAFNSESVAEEWVDVIERLTTSGGRLVLSFIPVEKKPAKWRISSCSANRTDPSPDQNDGQTDESADTQADADTGEAPSDSTSQQPISSTETQCVDLRDKWGLLLAFADTPATTAVKTITDEPLAGTENLPQRISWHTAVYFDDLDDSWRVIYSAEGRPVIVERSYGNGSLVLLADTFFISNEALRSERYPELLAWTVGPNTRIIFDETHLDIRKQPGVLSLIKKHRFHWFICAIAVLAVLFVWKNSAYFVPPPKNRHDPTGQGVYSSRDSTQGLISLLRRNIPAQQLLQTCAYEWRRAFQRNQHFGRDPSDSTNSVFEKMKAYGAPSNDPVVGYRQICKIISKGRHNE